MINQKYRFIATLYTVGINRCVDVPHRITQALGDAKYVPIVAMVRGHQTRTSLVPAGHGRHRLFLNGAIRSAAGVDRGDRVTIHLSRDVESREPSLPEDLAAALTRTPSARGAFDALTVAQRREFVRYLNQAKKPKTRQKRITDGLRIIKARAAKRLAKTHRQSGGTS